MSSPHSDSYESHARKRVGKACDRCRLKKSKCDGSNPCSRCKADNAICVFGERKKSHDKVYPKGYVEMLEQQQSQLVAGLRETYERLCRGEQWPGDALKEYDGHPLTHDILERLGVLHMTGENPVGPENFEDNLEALQQRLMQENGVSYARQRRGSPSSDSDPELIHSPHSTNSPPMRTSSVSSSISSRKRSSPATPPPAEQINYPSKHQRFAMVPNTIEAEPTAAIQNWQEPFVMSSPDAFDFTNLTTDTLSMYDPTVVPDFTTCAPINPLATSMSTNLATFDSDWDSFLRSGVHPTNFS